MLHKNEATWFSTPTETRKNMNIPYSILMYWTNFWQPTVHAPQNIFEKTLIEDGSSNICASFGTFCIQIGQLLEAQWVFEKCMKTVKSLFSKENAVDFDFFRKFKISLCLEYSTNLDAKGAKRSAKVWATNFYQIFFKNILLYMNGRLSKIRSVHTLLME